MSEHLTTQARKVLALAEEAARRFNHAYVGTEHILLGLVEERSGDMSDVLTILGIEASQVRAEVERLVKHGSEPVALRTLPLTPRSKRALEHARDEARNVNEKCIGPEHLLLGLVREETGVACHVLLNLGVRPSELRAEVLKIRLAQMKIVERAVRPVRAGTPRKRKMREELLAHLTAIYDQELDRLHNPTTALATAAQRFGDPLELARDLETALPYHERISHFVERWFAWRPPESAARYALRQAILTFYILAVVLPLVLAGVFLGYGWIEAVRTLARVFASVLLITPPAHFALTLLCLKMRDALWGAFGSRKSLARALAYDVLIALVVTVSFLGFAWAAELDFTKLIGSLTLYVTAGVTAAFAYFLLARFLGPTTIRHALWALLDIEGSAPGGDANPPGGRSSVEPV